MNVTVNSTTGKIEYSEPEPPVIDYTKKYLTFEMIEPASFTLAEVNGYVPFTDDCYFEYSYDGDNNWTHLDCNEPTPVFSAGTKVNVRASLPYHVDYDDGDFRFEWRYNSEDGEAHEGRINIEGSIMSLLYGSGFTGQTVYPSEYYYSEGFTFPVFSSINVVSAENLSLPLMRLNEYCYNSMFNTCTSLTTAPALPATTLTECCYEYMFMYCHSLTTAPALPATTLAEKCYSWMFYDCTSLTTAPALPATTLARYCYDGMFYSCTSLTTAPVLPATRLIYGCYCQMFCLCSNLNYIKMMGTNIYDIEGTTSINCLGQWVNGVAASGTFIKNTAMSEEFETGYSGIPAGWTVQEADS